MADLELSERWWGFRDISARVEAKRNMIFRELHREISPEHELFEKIVRVEAFFEATDDVIVRLVDSTFALVHPTYSGKIEKLPWSRTTPLGNAAEAVEHIRQFELTF